MIILNIALHCIAVVVMSSDVMSWLKVWVKQTKSDYITGHCLLQTLGGTASNNIFISHHKYFEADERHPPVTAEFSPRALMTLKRPGILE